MPHQRRPHHQHLLPTSPVINLYVISTWPVITTLCFRRLKPKGSTILPEGVEAEIDRWLFKRFQSLAEAWQDAARTIIARIPGGNRE